MKYELSVNVDFKIKLELTEQEAIALSAIAGYGHESFLKVFKEHMGAHYIEAGEKAIPALFKKLQDLQSSIDRVNQAKKLLKEMGDVQTTSTPN